MSSMMDLLRPTCPECHAPRNIETAVVRGPDDGFYTIVRYDLVCGHETEPEKENRLEAALVDMLQVDAPGSVEILEASA